MTTTNEGTQRNELAGIMAEWVTRGLRNDDAYAPLAEIEEAANVILAAGYRKPRTITTVEELDALPDGSVVSDSYSDVHEKIDEKWFQARDPHRYEPEWLGLPATVLQEPEAEVGA